MNAYDFEIAAMHGDAGKIRALLAAGVDPCADSRDWPFIPFYTAVMYPHEPILDLLHGTGESCLSGAPGARDAYDATPLHYAAALGHTERMRELIEQGADVAARDFAGSTPLHWAAYADATESARVLLTAGADANARDIAGRTPFFAAAYNANEDEQLLQALADAGADVYARDDENVSAFDYAWEEPYAADCVARRADPASAELLDAAYAGDIDRARKALARGANLHAKTYNQLSVTGMAIENKHYDLARYLISLGGVIEADSIWFEEYLHFFLRDDIPDLFEHCVAHSVDINAPNIVYDSPLLCCVARSGEIEYVKILLKHGADVNVKDKKGRTPLTLARNGGHAEVVTLLLAAGAEGNDGH